MITFLSSPKPFVRGDAANQIRAIKSWLLAVPDCEVMLFGLVEGADTALAELKCRYIADVPTAPGGLPLFNGIVTYACFHARYDIQVYLNCDILLTSSLSRAVNVAQTLPQFLLVGRRLDLGEGCTINPSESILDQLLKFAALDRIRVHPESGMDYFVFRRGMWEGLAPLIIGRGSYDNALLAYCLRRSIPVLDATPIVVAVHQFHRYEHVPNGKVSVFSGCEERQNRSLHDIHHAAPNIGDADFYFSRERMVPNAKRATMRRMETHLRFRAGQKLMSYGVRLARQALRAWDIHGSHPHELRALLEEYRRAELGLGTRHAAR